MQIVDGRTGRDDLVHVALESWDVARAVLQAHHRVLHQKGAGAGPVKERG